MTAHDVVKIVRDANSKGEWRWTCYTGEQVFYRLWDKHRKQRSPVLPVPLRVWFR